MRLLSGDEWWRQIAAPPRSLAAINGAIARSFLDAQDVVYHLAPSADTVTAPDVTSKGSRFTLLLECFKYTVGEE